ITFTALPGSATPTVINSITRTVTPTPDTTNTTTCATPTIDATGTIATCTVTIQNSTVQTFTVNATGVATMCGVQVTRATNGKPGTGGSGPATNNFVDASVTISPNGVNEITHQHIFNVTVTAMPGNATPVSFGTITPSVIGSPDSQSDTCGSPTINGNVATCT